MFKRFNLFLLFFNFVLHGSIDRNLVQLSSDLTTLKINAPKLPKSSCITFSSIHANDPHSLSINLDLPPRLQVIIKNTKKALKQISDTNPSAFARNKTVIQEKHITLWQFTPAVTSEHITKAAHIIQKNFTEPLPFSLRWVSTNRQWKDIAPYYFNKQTNKPENPWVIWINIQSDELVAFANKIKQEFLKAGIPIDTTYDYTPHITIAMIKRNKINGTWIAQIKDPLFLQHTILEVSNYLANQLKSVNMFAINTVKITQKKTRSRDLSTLVSCSVT